VFNPDKLFVQPVLSSKPQVTSSLPGKTDDVETCNGPVLVHSSAGFTKLPMSPDQGFTALKFAVTDPKATLVATAAEQSKGSVLIQFAGNTPKALAVTGKPVVW
jgi:hypothetical protein